MGARLAKDFAALRLTPLPELPLPHDLPSQKVFGEASALSPILGIPSYSLSLSPLQQSGGGRSLPSGAILRLRVRHRVLRPESL